MFWKRVFRGLKYIGPCRCGRGPHAYYVDDRGRLVHAWELYYNDLDAYLEELIREKKMLEEEIEKVKRELEKLKKEK
ncbi:hypothetical protein [Methanocaldococcus sp.]